MSGEDCQELGCPCSFDDRYVHGADEVAPDLFDLPDWIMGFGPDAPVAEVRRTRRELDRAAEAERRELERLAAKRVTVRLSGRQAAKLDRVSRHTGRSVGALIKMALDRTSEARLAELAVPREKVRAGKQPAPAAAAGAELPAAPAAAHLAHAWDAAEMLQVPVSTARLLIARGKVRRVNGRWMRVP